MLMLQTCRFALLPQQTENELAISEAIVTACSAVCSSYIFLVDQVHSKLDRALKFLQRDVGPSTQTWRCQGSVVEVGIGAGVGVK